jgi:hypothetical protein
MTSYVVGVTGDGPGAAKIRKYSVHPFIEEADRWVHVAALIQENGQWRIYECDFDEGTRCLPLDTWIAEQKGQTRLWAAACEFDLYSLKEHLGRPFSRELMECYKKGGGFSITPEGTTCGEYLAYAHDNDDEGYDICDWCGRFSIAMRAVDFQAWAYFNSVILPLQRVLDQEAEKEEAYVRSV